MLRRWPNRIPFGLKIGLSAALLSAAALLTFIVASAVVVFDSMIAEADFVLRNTARDLATEFAEAPPTADALEARRDQAPLNAAMSDIRIRYYQNSQLTWLSQELGWEGQDFGSAENSTTRRKTVWVERDLWRTYGGSLAGDQHIGLSINLQKFETDVWRMVTTYLSALPFAALIVGIGAWIFATRAVRPLRTLAAAMEQVARGDLRERIDLGGARDALDRLAGVFNRMAERLESSFEQATRFTSDASHELRTPLTVLRGQLENALQTAHGDQAMIYADLLEQTERLRNIIDGLLLLSRADVGKLSAGDEIVDFSALVRDVAQDFDDSFSEAGIAYRQRIEEGVRVRGDQQLLRQALGNLLGNAEKFNLAEDGRIELSLSETGNTVRLAVESTGPAIAEGDRERVFRRFYRAPSDRETPAVRGTGLGLSIVQASIEAHGGTVRCETGEGGTNRFVIELPSCQEPTKP